MEEIIKDFLWDMTNEAYPNPIRKAKELTKLIDKHLKEQYDIQRVSQSLCEDCKKPLPEGMKHRCYECYDDIYCPK